MCARIHNLQLMLCNVHVTTNNGGMGGNFVRNQGGSLTSIWGFSNVEWEEIRHTSISGDLLGNSTHKSTLENPPDFFPLIEVT